MAADIVSKLLIQIRNNAKGDGERFPEMLVSITSFSS